MYLTFIDIVFEQALCYYNDTNWQVPPKLQWFAEPKYVSVALNDKQPQLSKARPYIYSTFPAVTQPLMTACDVLSKRHQDKVQKAQDNLKYLAEQAVSKSKEECEKNNKNTKSKRNNKNNNNKNDNNNDVDIDISTGVLQGAQSENDNSNNNNNNSNNKSKKKSDEKKSEDEYNSDLDPPDLDAEEFLSFDELDEAWDNQAKVAASQVACMLIRAANLSNRSIQCINSLSQKKNEYLTLYSMGVAGFIGSDNSVLDKISWIARNKTWGVFTRALTLCGWNVIYDNRRKHNKPSTHPQTGDDINKACKSLIACEFATIKPYLCAELEFEDMLLLVKSPLADLVNAADSESKDIEAMGLVWKHIQKYKDVMFVVFMESQIMARGHFLKLAKTFYPQQTKELINDDMVNFETKLKQIVKLVLADSSFQQYKTNHKNDPARYAVPPKLLKILQDQLTSWLIDCLTLTDSAANKTSWKSQSYHPIIIGFFVPFLLWNHAPFLQKRAKNKSYPDIYTCHRKLTTADIYLHMRHLSSMMIKMFHCLTRTANVKQKLQKSRLNTVYPSNIKVLLQQVAQRPATVGDYCKFICSLGSFVYTLFYQKCFVGDTPGLSSQMCKYAETRGNWMDDRYWDRVTIPKFPGTTTRTKVIAVEAPVCDAISLVTGYQFTLKLASKLPADISKGNWFIAIFISGKVPGFDLMFEHPKGYRYHVDDARVWMNWYKEHGYPYTDSKSKEWIWTFIKNNNKHVRHKFIGLLRVGSCLGPNSAQIKWLQKNVAGYDKSMFVSFLKVRYSVCYVSDIFVLNVLCF